MSSYFPLMVITGVLVLELFKTLRASKLGAAKIVSLVITAGILLIVAGNIPWQSQIPLWVWYLLSLVSSLSIALATAKFLETRRQDPHKIFE